MLLFKLRRDLDYPFSVSAVDIHLREIVQYAICLPFLKCVIYAAVYGNFDLSL